MKRKYIMLCILVTIVVLVVGILYMRQPKQIAEDIASHDITYYQELIVKKDIYSDGIAEVLHNLPRNAVLKQTSSVVDNEGSFNVLGIAFERGANVKTILYDTCLLFAFYENADAISISFEDNEKYIEKKSIEQFMEKNLTHETLVSKEQWDEINKHIQEMDEDSILSFLMN